MMRTNIVIDDDLMERAMTAAGTTTKRATVEEGLRALIAREKPHPYAGLLALRGKLHWEGDLDAERTDIDDDEVEW